MSSLFQLLFVIYEKIVPVGVMPVVFRCLNGGVCDGFCACASVGGPRS